MRSFFVLRCALPMRQLSFMPGLLFSRSKTRICVGKFLALFVHMRKNAQTKQQQQTSVQLILFLFRPQTKY